MGKLKRCENEQCLASNDFNAKFCLKCGHAFSSEEPVMAAGERTLSRPVIWKKPWFISVISMVILVVVLYVTGLFLYNKNTVITAATKAAETDNVELLFEQITVPANVKYSEGSYKDYLKENNLHTIADTIESVVTRLAEDKESAPYVLDANGNRLLEVIKQKKFGIYSTYTLQAVGYELNAQANMEDVTFEMLDETTTTDESGHTSLGMLLPGTYTLDAKATSSTGDLTHKLQIVHPTGFEESTAEVYFETYDIYLDTPYPEAELIIDGETTGQTIAQYGDVIASVPEGQTVSVSAVLEVDDDTYKSEKFEVSSEETVYFEFPEYEVIQTAKTFGKEEAQTFLESYRAAYEQAIIAADFSYVSDYFQSGTETYKEYEKFVNDHREFESYNYTFMENKFKSFEQAKDLTVTVETFESLIFTSDGEAYLYERDKRYTLVFDEKSNGYLIGNIEILNTEKTKQ
ncbi:TcaA NTF2-like domain-containing protein [Peribacillus frigoritolerans]|uniref:TcaA NTF2-like domain-containing protein n=1 Tax=Peribacillus frigoritolerans TaxID=450367 RepID=UPI0039A38E71